MRLTVDESPFGTRAPRFLDRLVLSLTRRLPDNAIGLRLAILLRRITTMRLGLGGLDSTIFGLNLRLYPKGNGCEKGLLFTPQMFEPLERRVLADKVARVLEQGRDVVFVDIGANVGLFSLVVAGLAKGRARVLAIEPQPFIKDRLAFNLTANPGLDIRPVGVALADRDGEVDLFIDQRDHGGTRIGGRGDLESERVTVRARLLAPILAEEGFEGADILKIDIEGAEDIVLGPFLRAAPVTALPKCILIEDSHALWSTDLFALLRQRGYVECERSKQNIFFELKP